MFILVFLYITMGLGIALSVFALVASGLDLVSKSKTPALSYEDRWTNTDYVKMIHRTRELEKENLGEALTDCKCSVCDEPKLLTGPAPGAKIISNRIDNGEIRINKNTIVLAGKYKVEAKNTAPGRVPRRAQASPKAPTIHTKNKKYTLPNGVTINRPSNVPGFATATSDYDPMMMCDRVVWSWDYEDGQTYSVVQNHSSLADESHVIENGGGNVIKLFSDKTIDRRVEKLHAGEYDDITVDELLGMHIPAEEVLKRIAKPRKESGITLRTPRYNDAPRIGTERGYK